MRCKQRILWRFVLGRRKGGSFIAAMREKEKPQLLYQKLGHTMVNPVNDDTADDASR